MREEFEPTVATHWAELTVAEVIEMGSILIDPTAPVRYALVIDGDAQLLVLTAL